MKISLEKLYKIFFDKNFIHGEFVKLDNANVFIDNICKSYGGYAVSYRSISLQKIDADRQSVVLSAEKELEIYHPDDEFIIDNMEEILSGSFDCNACKLEISSTLNFFSKVEKFHSNDTQSYYCLELMAYGMRDLLMKDDIVPSKKIFIETECSKKHISYKNLYKLNPSNADNKFLSADGPINFEIIYYPNYDIAPTNKINFADAIRAMDKILAVCCVSLFADFDPKIRREYCGLPGDFKYLKTNLKDYSKKDMTKHNLTYGTLSSAWQRHPVTVHLVLDLARKVLKFGLLGYLKYWNSSDEETIDCILNSDVKAAHKIMRRNKILLMKIMKSSYVHCEHGPDDDDDYDYDDDDDYSISKKGTVELYNIFFNGVQTVIKDLFDFKNNWSTDEGYLDFDDFKIINVKNLIFKKLKDKKYSY